MAIDLAKLRWLMFEQGSTSISLPVMVVLVFWLAIVFTSFGLFAPPNLTVIATLFLCALSVSGAIFLILAMYTPFRGVMQISSAPLRNALAHLGQSRAKCFKGFFTTQISQNEHFYETYRVDRALRCPLLNSSA